MCDFSNLEHLFEAGKYSEWMNGVRNSMDEYFENVVLEESSRLHESGDFRASNALMKEWEDKKVYTLIEKLERIFQAGANVAWMSEVRLCMEEYDAMVDGMKGEAAQKSVEIEKKRELRLEELKKDSFFNRIFKKEKVEKAKAAAAKYEKEIDSLKSERAAALGIADEWSELATTMGKYSQSRLSQIINK